MKTKQTPSQKSTTLVRVDKGTAKLLNNLRNKYKDKREHTSVDLVIKGLWREVCELRIQQKKNALEKTPTPPITTTGESQ